MRRILLLSGLVLPLAASSLLAQAVSTAANRESAVAAAAKLASTGESAAAPRGVTVDPFNPPASNLSDVAPEETGKATGMSDAQLVDLLIAEIKPTGSVQLAGEPYLLFTERRQKIGDKLVVTLAKVEYTIEIVSISNNRFRIRYNGQEAERPIK